MTHARLYLAANFREIDLLQPLLQQSVDVEHFITDSFSIADARRLQNRAELRPVERLTRDFVIHFSSITSEAQNALLKLLEEPPATTVFHIIVARESILLPTVRSRLFLMNQGPSAEVSESPAFENFCALTLGERMAEIQVRTKAKDNHWIEELLRGAEQAALSADRNKKLLETLLFIRQHVGARGSSPKLLLEELALVLP